jgi:GT2 family glycosyltransferase
VNVAVVSVAYNCEARLTELAEALSGVVGEGDEVVVVDNASSDGTAQRARALGLDVVETGSNLGYGAGCRAGVRATSAPLLLFLNPDARPQAGSLARLRAVADERPDWAAWQPAVMLPDGRINTSGGVVHYLGLSWAGGCERPASELARAPYDASFASGAALMIRRDAWDELDGFDDSYFLYGEDLELGLRLRLTGHGVGVEPRARVIHDYEFGKGSEKWFLLERNRWRTLLALYPGPLLALLAPALLLSEVGLLVVAARDGWLGAKLRADLAVLGGVPRALRRRAAVRPQRRIDAIAFAALLSSSLDNPHIARLPRALVVAQAAYFAVVRRLLRLPSAGPVSIARSAGGEGSGRPEAP